MRHTRNLLRSTSLRSYFDLETKYSQLKAGVSRVFIDPVGCQNYVACRERAFRKELAKQKGE
jgi:hypothetical protein